MHQAKLLYPLAQAEGKRQQPTDVQVRNFARGASRARLVDDAKNYVYPQIAGRTHPGALMLK
jgi:hypothetical protein